MSGGAEQPASLGRQAWASRFRRGPAAAIGESAPYAILAYVLILAALRLSFSDFLEVDEAEFVGRVDLRLLYDNSHPPLFNWLTRVMLELTGWDWALSVSVVKYGALALFHLSVWSLAMALGGPRSAALAVAASAFLPQIVWMSATTLAHSTLIAAASAGALWAAHRALVADGRRAVSAFALFGLIAAAGALSKFNYGLFLLPFLAVLAADPVLRPRLLRPAALAGLAVFLLVAAPSLVAALLNLETSADRIDKLYRADGPFAVVDPPLIGVDGALSLVVALLAWAAPAAVFWAVALWRDREKPAPQTVGGPVDSAFATALGRAMAAALALFALIVLAADMHSVHERYLTPLLAATPVWLAVRWPIRRSAGPILGLAGVAYVAVLIGFWAQVSFSNHRFNIPYDALAGFIARETQEPVPILSARRDDGANALVALGWPGAATPTPAPPQTAEAMGDAVILLWRGRGAAPAAMAPDGFGPAAAVVTVALRYRNDLDRPLVYSFQLFERL